MKIKVRSHVVSADNIGLLRQLQETYGCRVAHLAVKHQPFLKIGELYISPCCDHPLLGIRSKKRRSFDARTNTYFVSPPADYLRLASSDWPTRVVPTPMQSRQELQASPKHG